MQKSLDKHKDHPSVKCFPVQESITASTAAYNVLETLKASVDSWSPPLPFDEHRQSIYSAVKEFFRCVDDTMGYQECLVDTTKMATQSRDSVKRKWRGHRDAFQAIFTPPEANDSYNAVEKTCADIMTSVNEDPSAIGIQSCSYACSFCSINEHSTKDVFVSLRSRTGRQV